MVTFRSCHILSYLTRKIDDFLKIGLKKCEHNVKSVEFYALQSIVTDCCVIFESLRLHNLNVSEKTDQYARNATSEKKQQDLNPVGNLQTT